MIENKNEASRNLEKALQELEQAKQRVANEKKKQNEKKRKAGEPLPYNPHSPMPKMKARAVRNDKGKHTFFHSETELLLKGIYEVEKNERQCYIREFSVEVFRESKGLEI